MEEIDTFNARGKKGSHSGLPRGQRLNISLFRKARCRSTAVTIGCWDAINDEIVRLGACVYQFERDIGRVLGSEYQGRKPEVIDGQYEIGIASDDAVLIIWITRVTRIPPFPLSPLPVQPTKTRADIK